jgi:glycolate oxidase FAD binding subunit
VEPENQVCEAPVIADSLAALAALVAEAGASGVPLVDYGLAHAGLGHAPPARHRRLELRAPSSAAGGVLEHYQRDFAVRVAAGAAVGAVRAALRPAGQFLPLDADDDLTIGEVIAHNLYGPLRVGYGGVRDLLLGLAYLDGLGRDIRAGGRTVKNVAGYDLTRFMVGSLGEFGVIHEATLRTCAIPETVLLVAVHTDDLGAVDAGLTEWLASDAVSTHMGWYWDAGRWLIHRGYFGSVRGCAVQVQALEKQMEPLTDARLAGTQQITLDDDFAQRAGRRAWRRRPEVTAVVKIIVPPAVTGRVCQMLLDWARGAGVEPRIDAVPVHGMVLTGGVLSAAQGASLDQMIRGIIGPLGGVRVWVRRPEGEPQIEPFFPTPPEWPMLLRLKKACDPRGILNPGRCVPVDGAEGRIP